MNVMMMPAALVAGLRPAIVPQPNFVAEHVKADGDQRLECCYYERTRLTLFHEVQVRPLVCFGAEVSHCCRRCNSSVLVLRSSGAHSVCGGSIGLEF